MTRDETPAHNEAPACSPDQAGPQPFDTSVARQARMYNYMPGGRKR